MSKFWPLSEEIMGDLDADFQTLNIAWGFLREEKNSFLTGNRRIFHYADAQKVLKLRLLATQSRKTFFIPFLRSPARQKGEERKL